MNIVIVIEMLVAGDLHSINQLLTDRFLSDGIIELIF